MKASWTLVAVAGAVSWIAGILAYRYLTRAPENLLDRRLLLVNRTVLSDRWIALGHHAVLVAQGEPPTALETTRQWAERTRPSARFELFGW